MYSLFLVFSCCFYAMNPPTKKKKKKKKKKNVALPWVVTSTGPGGFMICVCIL